MTWLGPADVLDIAKGAGWTGTDAKVAAAVALVATEGADHYEWQHPSDPGAGAVGLWAIPIPDLRAEVSRRLLSPAAAAAWAYTLWDNYGGSWEWHFSYNRDDGATVRRLVASLDSSQGWRVRAHHVSGRLMPETLPPPPLSVGDIISSGPAF